MFPPSAHSLVVVRGPARNFERLFEPDKLVVVEMESISDKVEDGEGKIRLPPPAWVAAFREGDQTLLLWKRACSYFAVYPYISRLIPWDFNSEDRFSSI